MTEIKTYQDVSENDDLGKVDFEIVKNFISLHKPLIINTKSLIIDEKVFNDLIIVYREIMTINGISKPIEPAYFVEYKRDNYHFIFEIKI